MAISSYFCVPLRVAGVLATLVTTPSAADESLYDSPPPVDAIFVRWLEPQAHQTGAEIWGHSVSTDIGTDYTAISAATLGQGEPGGFYSVIRADGGAQVIAEPARADRAKVHLFLVSCGGRAVALVVPGRAGSTKVTPVIGPLDALGAAGRAVNPVATPLAVIESANQVELARFDLTLARGKNLTFYVCDGQVRMIENQISRHVAG